MSAVARFVEIALVVQLLQHGLHRTHVARVGSLGPAVECHTEFLPQRFEFRRDLAREPGRSHTGFFGRLLHFLSVLIHTGEKKNRASSFAVPA